MSKIRVSKFVVAAPLLAVAVLALFMAWGHSFSSQTQAATPTGIMELTVKSGTIPCPVGSVADFCVAKGGTFTLSAEITKIPTGGYIGIQTEIDYATLVANGGNYKPTTAGADEITWPCAAFCLRSPASPTGVEGLVNHAGATGSTPPFPAETYTGNATDLSMNCSAADSVNVINLVPLASGNTNGSGFKPTSGSDIPQSDTITVECAQGPTPTPVPPTNTPPANPQMQKLCDGQDEGTEPDTNLCNLFMEGQGPKIPPLNCQQGTSTVTLSERLSIPIPNIPDPKDPSIPMQFGAFEFEVHFDDSQVCVNIEPGAIITNNAAPENFICVIEDKDSSLLEGVARIGCVTIGKPTTPMDTTAELELATITISPQPELFNEIKPNQDNGSVVQIQNVGCEIADIQGHPIALFSCEDAEITIRFLEGDVVPDCAVNALDTQAIAFRWGSQKGSLVYVWFMNLEPSGTQADNDIDIKDLQFVFGRFGSTCDAPWPAQKPVNPKAFGA